MPEQSGNPVRPSWDTRMWRCRWPADLQSASYPIRDADQRASSRSPPRKHRPPPACWPKPFDWPSRRCRSVPRHCRLARGRHRAARGVARLLGNDHLLARRGLLRRGDGRHRRCGRLHRTCLGHDRGSCGARNLRALSDFFRGRRIRHPACSRLSPGGSIFAVRRRRPRLNW